MGAVGKLRGKYCSILFFSSCQDDLVSFDGPIRRGMKNASEVHVGITIVPSGCNLIFFITAAVHTDKETNGNPS